MTGWWRKAPLCRKKSRLGEAFAYTLNQWDALCYYCDDGLAEADNNAAERALRAVCLGKKIISSSEAITEVSVVHCCTD
ncbi:IS66 family transposase [Rahnella perminowiae]|uniref:IS66 family transposase n=1 Tax=Rahnella perminowiae TaxID=2816244 RepID=UPI003B8A6141